MYVRAGMYAAPYTSQMDRAPDSLNQEPLVSDREGIVRVGLSRDNGDAGFDLCTSREAIWSYRSSGGWTD